jgi:hypothetical protein
VGKVGNENENEMLLRVAWCIYLGLIGDRRRPAEEGGVEGRAAVWMRWGVTRGHTQIDPF